MSGALPGPAMREARRGLAGARDDQVLRVVVMLDGLEDRGDSDMILAPVRGRLRTLQPPRPFRLPRLLFLPVDPLIVDAGAWRPGGPRIPRTALACLAALVREESAPEILRGVEAHIAAGRVSARAPGEAGALLWPEAASILLRASTGAAPRSWRLAGLPEAEFEPLLCGLAPILMSGTRLAAWEQERAPLLAETALVELLREAATCGARAWGMMLALLLARFPRHAAPFEAALSPAMHQGPGFGDAATAALEMGMTLLEEAGTFAPACAGAAGAIGRLASLGEGLAARLPDQARRARVAEARMRLRQLCLAGFASGLRAGLAERVAGLSGTADDDEMLERAEADSRRLRQFENEARRLGGGGQYDVLLGSAAAALRSVPCLEPADRARLIEILQGPEAALRSLHAKV